MGDASDMSDIERFMRSPEGKAYLEQIRGELIGKRVAAVEFSNSIFAIDMELILDDGTAFEYHHRNLEVNAIRQNFADVLQREYYADYPERAE